MLLGLLGILSPPALLGRLPAAVAAEVRVIPSAATAAEKALSSNVSISAPSSETLKIFTSSTPVALEQSVAIPVISGMPASVQPTVSSPSLTPLFLAQSSAGFASTSRILAQDIASKEATEEKLPQNITPEPSDADIPAATSNPADATLPTDIRELGTASDSPFPSDLVNPDEPSTILNSPSVSDSIDPAELSSEDIFEEVFGQPQNASPQQVMVPVIVNDQNRGQVLVIVPGGNQVDVLVAADDFLAAVTNILRSDLQQQLESYTAPDGTLNLRNIRQVGLQVSFDSSRLELQVQVPPELRSTTVLNMPGEIPPEFATALPPSNFSGYLNMRGGYDLQWSGNEDNFNDFGGQPLRLNFDGAINAHGWVLEGSLNFSDDDSSSWERDDISLIHDDLNSAVRYQLGDLSLPVQGYQQSIPMLGVTVARNFALQPYTVTRPISRFEFFLERPSTVEVFVNDQLVQTLQLDAGPQDIRDLPLNAGINGVQLVITDDVGQVQRLDFAAGVAGGLLAPGLQQFAYSFGFPSEVEGLSRSYDFSQPTLTLSHRFGAADNLTLGGYVQGDLTTQLIGLEGIWASTVGNFGWDMALSHDNQVGIGAAAQLYYDLLTRGESSSDQRSLRLGAEYRSANFMTLGEEEPSNPTSLDLSVSYSQLFFGDMRATVSGRYQFARDDASDGYNFALALSKPIGQNLTLNINGSYGMNTSGEQQQRLFLGLTASFPSQRQFVNANTVLDSENNSTSRFAWSYSSPLNVGGLDTSFTTELNSDNLRFVGQTRYRGYRAELNFEQIVGLPRGNEGSSANISRFTWGTALVFADGAFGWSRPINDSFALITRRGTAEDLLVQVNPGPGGEIARADHWGAAVVPLSPYFLSTLSLKAPHLPVGSELGPSEYTLFPTYRSGTRIRVGTEATVYLRGVLLDTQGNPLALRQGRVISLSDPDWPVGELFTNRAGRFAVTGLKPGQYEIRLYGVEDVVATITIPEDTTGVFDLEPMTTPVMFQ